MAPHLTGRDGGVSLRRLRAECEIVSCQRGRIDRRGVRPASGGNRRSGA